MKVRARANGNIVDVSDGEVEALLLAGIYERIDGEPTPRASKAPAASAKAPAEGSTKVAPLMTRDMPTPPMKPKKGL